MLPPWCQRSDSHERARLGTLSAIDLRDSWERHAADWIRWAREPGHDSYWRFHREQFLELVPRPGRRTLDVGCGEGRVSRDLQQLGHRVIGVDSSEAMISAAREADPDGEYLVADAAALPLTQPHFRFRIGTRTWSSPSCR